MAATALPPGLPASPSSASAPRGLLDEALGGGPRVPWLAAFLADLVRRADIQSGWGAAFSIDADDRSGAAFSIDADDRSRHAYSTTDDDRSGDAFSIDDDDRARDAYSSSDDRSSPAPSHIDVAVSLSGTNPVVRRRDAWARNFDPAILPDEDGIWEAGGSQFQRGSYPACSQIHEDGLTLQDGDGLPSSTLSTPSAQVILGSVKDELGRALRQGTVCENFLTVTDESQRVLTLDTAPERILEEADADESKRFFTMGAASELILAGTAADESQRILTLDSSPLRILADELGRALRQGTLSENFLTATDESQRVLTLDTAPERILAETAAAESRRFFTLGTAPELILAVTAAREYEHLRLPAPLRGYMGSLPKELVARIAKILVKVSIRDAISMKLACKSWSAAFEISGPMLVVSRHEPASPAVTIFRIASGNDDQLVLVPVDCLYPPPVHTTCWGSCKGLLALKFVTDDSIVLHCPTCGFRRALPNLPLNFDPKGVFLQAENFIVALMKDLTVQQDNELELDTTLMFLQRLLVAEDNAEDDGLIWFWDMYPGAEHFSPVRTVNFTPNATLAASTAWNVFILDSNDRLPNQPFLTVNLNEGLALDNSTVTWMHHGQHIFVIDESAYICMLTRSTLDSSIVGIVCFLIEHNPGSELRLVKANYIGPYSVYLGSNQPLVLTAMDGIPGRSPNTIYIEDHDGLFRNRRVVAINVETQAVQSISFPETLQFGPLDNIASAWLAPNSLNCHTL